MNEIIKKFKVDGVWHFTDEANFESIIGQGGLLSFAELQRRGIAIPAAGGNEWSHDADVHAGVQGFVHLAFIFNHPMLYRAKQDGRITRPYWLKIDPSVLTLSGVRFTCDVANKSGVKLLTPEEAITGIDWGVLFTRMDWSDPAIMARRQAAEKSEILVPNCVPLNKILGKMNG
jgi:hypothetical protein